MKKRHLNFKQLFTVSFLAVAGLFGITSIAIDDNCNANQETNEVVAKESDHDYSNHKHIWFYEACDWAGSYEFDDSNNTGSQYFTIWQNSSSGQIKNKCYFGKSYLSSESASNTQNCGSEVYGSRLAKIFYDPSITYKIEVHNGTGWSSAQDYLDIVISDIPSGIEEPVFVLGRYHYTGWGGGSKQTGKDDSFNPWISYDTLVTTWVRPMYITVDQTSTNANWASYKANPNNLWIWSQTDLANHNKTAQTNREYSAYQLVNRTNVVTFDGNTYVEILIPRDVLIAGESSKYYTKLQNIQIRIAFDGSDAQTTHSIPRSNLVGTTLPCAKAIATNGSSEQEYWAGNFEFSINYLDKGGSAFSGDQTPGTDAGFPTSYTYTVGTSFGTPTKDDYTFMGFYLNSDCTGDPITSLSTTDGGNKTLYARWGHTINWLNYDGSTLKSDVFDHGSTPEYTGATPTKPQVGDRSYDFSGWDPEIEEATENTSYTATFTENIVSAKDTTIMVATTDDGNKMPNYTTFYDTTVAIYCWNNSNTFKKTVEAHHIDNTRICYATLPAGINYFMVVRMTAGASAASLPFDGWPGDNGWTVNNQWNQMAYQYSSGDHLSKNLIQIDGWNSDNQYWESSRIILPQGMPVYVYSEVDWWFNKDDESQTCKYYLYHSLSNNYYGYNSWTNWQEMTRVGNTNYLYFVPNSTIVADFIISTRNKHYGSGWDNKLNQTTNITIGDGYYNTTVTDIESGQTDSNQNWGNKGIPETINAYGAFFMDKVQCSGQGSISSSDWTSVTNHYNNLGLSTQGNIWMTTPNIGGTLIEQAMARYDYIVFYKHYTGYEDFIGRSKTGSGKVIGAIHNFSIFSLFNDDDSNISLLIIIIASSVALISITALSVLLVKKRKRAE